MTTNFPQDNPFQNNTLVDAAALWLAFGVPLNDLAAQVGGFGAVQLRRSSTNDLAIGNSDVKVGSYDTGSSIVGTTITPASGALTVHAQGLYRASATVAVASGTGQVAIYFYVSGSIYASGHAAAMASTSHQTWLNTSDLLALSDGDVVQLAVISLDATSGPGGSGAGSDPAPRTAWPRSFGLETAALT